MGLILRLNTMYLGDNRNCCEVYSNMFEIQKFHLGWTV
jgi:hypothetical protein